MMKRNEKKIPGTNQASRKLSEQQLLALDRLNRVRKDFRKNYMEIWNGDFSLLEPLYFNSQHCDINENLKAVGLLPIQFQINISKLPLSENYYLLSDDEMDSWEMQAEKLNSLHPDELRHTGHSLWTERSSSFSIFVGEIQKINRSIEKYFNEIDKMYGTTYSLR